MFVLASNEQFQLNELSARYHRTKSKGDAAEAMAQAAFVLAGFTVSRPTTENSAYDLAVDDGERLAKVQVKWARREGDYVRIWTSTVSGTANRSYAVGDCDFFAAYAGEIGKLYVVPFDVVRDRKAIRLRLLPARNGQTVGIHWADDFEFRAQLPWPHTRVTLL